MKKSLIISIGLIWLSTAISSMAIDQSPKAVEKWFNTLPQRHQKVTKLHFYFHRLGGSAPSAATIAKANTTTPYSFGLTVMRDDPLTVGPDISSAHIGYAQGMSATVSLEEVVLVDYFTLSFTNDGSTLAVLGSNAIFHQYRELPIVGGTGAYRLARGVITFQTHFFNATTREASIQADAVVFHY